MFPYSVGGIIILGLIVGSIREFAQEISRDNIFKPAAEKRRVRMIDRSVTSTVELEQRQADQTATCLRLTPFLRAPATVRHASRRRTLRNGTGLVPLVRSRNQKLLLLQEEKDRFDAMRDIQRRTSNFKRYSALTTSVVACKPFLFALRFGQHTRSTAPLVLPSIQVLVKVSTLPVSGHGYGWVHRGRVTHRVDENNNSIATRKSIQRCRSSLSRRS